jgi:hypothetical protein
MPIGPHHRVLNDFGNRRVTLGRDEPRPEKHLLKNTLKSHF